MPSPLIGQIFYYAIVVETLLPGKDAPPPPPLTMAPSIVTSYTPSIPPHSA
jgi:hypothetical protein